MGEAKRFIDALQLSIMTAQGIVGWGAEKRSWENDQINLLLHITRKKSIPFLSENMLYWILDILLLFYVGICHKAWLGP